ncbi:MAG: NAD(P)-dependent oxidoreductase [Treponema sp.]|jgi:nucleoside-diphosphate-sugar epimerase|nr:NAD(P)-dependent oxidoreductase [Treponema sp.]
MKKHVLVTGNLGYIGSTMVPVLAQAGYEVSGYDIGYYADCYLTESPQPLVRRIPKDIRDVVPEDLAGIDTVVHLAGLSNDPLGEFNASITEDINFKASIRLAECAKKAGVRRFLYTSSQSVYGVSDTSKDVDENGAINPITAYAKTKWQSECELKKLCSDDFVITCLRPATAYGASPNLRTDIVFNAFVAYAYTNKLIEIKSDGTPWRPMTHIRDIAAAFIACIEAPAERIYNQVFNVGTGNNNYTVRQLAEAARNHVSGTELTFTGEHTDPRSYRVSSQKILTVLKDYYRPQWDIEKGGEELMRFYQSVNFDSAAFNSYKCTRLKALKKRIEDGTLDENLRVKAGK